MLAHVTTPEASDEWERRLRANTSPAETLKAVSALGLAALRGDPSEQSHHLTAVQELIWARVSAWYRTARHGETVEQRATASDALKHLGTALAGDLRGHKAQPAASSAEVLFTYKRNRLRLREAKRLIDSTHRGVSSEEQVAEAADAFDIPPDIFRSFLGLVGDGTPRGLSEKESARAWAGREHRTTEQRVSNILSELRSRK